MFRIAAEPVVSQTSSIDFMLKLLGNFGLMRLQVEAISATSEFVYVVIFECKFALRIQAVIRTHSDGVIQKFSRFGITIAIVIVRQTVAISSVQIHSGLIVVGHNGSVQVHRMIGCCSGLLQVVSCREIIVQSFFGNNIDGACNGARTVQS